MRPHRTLLALAAIAGLLLGGGLVSAEDESSPPRHWREFCQENPGKCEQARAKHKAFCEENPQQCEKMKQKRAERREWCRQNPERCEQQSAEWKQRRADRKAKCAADPAKCEQMKQQMRERRQQGHSEHEPGAAEQPAP